MAEPKVFSPEAFQALIGPLEGEQPAGIDLRDDERLGSEFRAVRDARDAASNAEKKLWEYVHLGPESEERSEKPKPADWKKVFDLSVEVLSHRSKDLWVAAWMIEAAVRVHGFQGFHDGVRVARELTERYWDGLYPRPESDEEQADEVLKTLVKLDLLDDVRPNVNLITQFDLVPITENKGLRALTSADYKEALTLEESSDHQFKAQRLDAGAVLLKEFQEVVEETSSDFFLSLIQDLQDSLTEFAALHEAVRERCGGSRPPAAENIRAALEACLERVVHIAGQTVGDERNESDEGGSTGTGGTGKAGGPAVGQINSRDDAFKALLKVSEYFRRAEPHSPVSYALEQAVRWGKMTLPELLEDLVPNKEVLSDMFLRTGIVRQEKQDES